MTEAPPLRAVIYARISQDREGAGLGVDRQVNDCRQLAERLGWSVVAVHSDNDVSAYSGKPRPGYRALLGDLEAGRAHGVLVWHTDRLHRSPTELERYIEVCEPRGIATHTVKAGLLDLATATGQMTARITGAVATFESKHKGDRVRAARQQAAQAGRWGGGVRPFGFEADGVTVRQAEADVIVRATDELLAGAGLRSVVRDLNASKVRTTFKADVWSARSFKDVLLRPRNAGLAVYRGEVIGPAAWPAIVPEDRWRALVVLLTDPGRRTTPGGTVRWLGSGLYVCGVCLRPWLRVHNSGGHRGPAYRCNSRESLPQTTGHVVRKAADVDSWIERVLVERLCRPDAAELLRVAPIGVDVDGLHAEAVELRQRLTQLGDAFTDGEVTLAQLTRGNERLQRRLGEVDAELAAAAAGDPLAGLVDVPDPAAAWARLDVGRKRVVLDVLMTVTVLPSTRKRGPGGQRFDPDSVRVEWKR